MKTSNLVRAAILLALGTVLHLVVPGFINGMKPDFLLVTMFIAIYLTNDFKSTVVIGIASGILAGATTTFPGGQLPSVLDKVISAISFYLCYIMLFNKFKNIKIGILLNTMINTLVSGIVFLLSVKYLVGMNIPNGINLLLLTVVLPTTIINGAFSYVFTKVISNYKKFL